MTNPDEALAYYRQRDEEAVAGLITDNSILLKEFTMKDSGEREEMPSGAVRDSRKGKGRFDLIPVQPLQRLARVYELGAEKYGDRNWEKGMDDDRLYDSAMRHLIQWRLGLYDEDHLGHALFNIMAIMHFQGCRD